MNSKGEENRSVRLTRKRLSDALITLLMQKPVREITVRELTELANVSRGTFYFHYTDIYDLMDHVERELGVPVLPVAQDGYELLDAMCGISSGLPRQELPRDCLLYTSPSPRDTR